MKKRGRKSNRVSWATGSNLCQVKLFLSDDYPSKVGLKPQGNLEGKASGTNESADLPPGFESSHFLNQSNVEFSRIPKIKWECPPPFDLSRTWRVAAGEESREKIFQKRRELRVLEAVYPRHSAIPPSPSVSLDVEEEDYDDNNTPIIPLIPIEEEEYMAEAVNPHPNDQSQDLHKYTSGTTSSRTISSDACLMPIAGASSGSVATSSRTISSDACLMPIAGASSGSVATSSRTISDACVIPIAGASSGSVATSSRTISDACVMPIAGSGSVADIAAASDVVAAILKSNEQGSLIDMDLLVKILNDPKMIESLIREHGVPATTVSSFSNSVVTATSGLNAATSSVPLFTSTPEVAASRNTHTSSVGFSGLKPTTPSVSSLNPTSGKPATMFAPATPSYSIVTSSHDKPATASVPLSRPASSKPVSPSVFVPTPTPATPHMPTSTPAAPHMPRPVNNGFHMSNGMPTALNSQPRPDSYLAPGVKRSASYAFASMSSSEQSTVLLPPSTRTSHTVLNHTQTTASTKPYQTSTGSASAVKKDANYYKNLIRQHGADGQDKLDSQIGTRRSNFQDKKSVNNNNQGEVKFKSKKQCIYFNSSRGCRNGSDCPFQHDVSAQSGAGNNFLGGSNAKRFKL